MLLHRNLCSATRLYQVLIKSIECQDFFFKVHVVDRKRLRVFKSLVYQMPLVQLAIIVLIVLLTEAEVIRRDKVKIANLF